MTESRNNIHQKVHEFGLFLLVASLPLSKFTLSVSQLLLVANWLLWGNPLPRFKVFFENRLALVLVSLFLLHVTGLAYTSDFNYALKDLRIKLPLLALPIILSSTPKLSLKKTGYLFAVFAGATAVGVGSSLLAYFGWIAKEVSDIRNISIYISHIRFALIICLVIFFSVFAAFKFRNSIRWLLFIYAGFLIFFLIMFESITGLVALTFGALCLGVYFLLNAPNKKYRWVAIIPTLAIFLIASPIIKEYRASFSAPDIYSLTLKESSKSGEQYYNNLNRNEVENGNYVWVHVAFKELEKSWNNRSDIDFYGQDNKNQPLHATLIRYLASKGLTKDAEGLAKLTDEEIKFVESGVTNYRFPEQRGIQERIYKILWEIDHFLKGGNPGGNSVMQRLEFWKTGYFIAKENPLIGVGTGDIKNAFKNKYKELESRLEKKYWLRTHNQYFTILITFGFIGLIWFLGVLFYPLFYFPKTAFFIPYLAFLAVVGVSFISEDTLETQIGVTIYAFFNSFLLLGYQKD